MNTRGEDISQAIADELNGAARPWFGKLTAERKTLPVFLADKGVLDSVKVQVFPLTLETELASRAPLWKETYGIGIDIQQAVELNDGEFPQDQIDGLDALAEQVYDWFADCHFLTVGGTADRWQALGRARQEMFDMELLYATQAWQTLIVATIVGYVE